MSRRYLLAEIDDLADEFSEVDENGLHSERWCGIVDAKLIIMNAPSVSDRPQGEWKNYKDEHYCTNCGEVVIGDWYNEDDWYDFCPHCGAKMKGADDDL